MCSKRTEVEDEDEDEDYDHGYHIYGCEVCGWMGWTDTGNCEGCITCRECGKPYTDTVPCECKDDEE